MLSSESTEEIEKQAGMISRKYILWLFVRSLGFSELFKAANLSRKQQYSPPYNKENTLKKNVVILDFAKPNSLNSFVGKSAIRLIDDAVQIKINR